MPSVLGFDFGLRRIGVAFGQTITGTASPLMILLAQQGTPDWSQVEKLIKEWRPDHIVVGLPLNMDGSESDICHQARKFSSQLENYYQGPIHLIDERLSSVAAESLLDPRKRQRSDNVAAMIIVETWLSDQEKNLSEPNRSLDLK